jgi:hypothetical protein
MGEPLRACPCGGRLESVTVEINASGLEEPLNVVQSRCPLCGSRSYYADSLFRIEHAIATARSLTAS